MPTISRFYGISIRMYFLPGEHNPPHIHATYGEYTASINFITGEVIDGYLPPKALQLVKEWIELHKDELQAMWDSQDFNEIPPLE